MGSFTRLQGLPPGSVPYPDKIKEWRNRLSADDQKVNEEPPATAWIPNACGPDKLYPTHPQQSLKRYHATEVATYDTPKVPAGAADTEDVCTIKTNQKDPKCLMSTTYEYAVLSDTLEDKCGNKYRGYIARGFLKNQENMGTLFSPGRTAYPKAGGDPREFEYGQTYPVDTKDLVHVGPLLPGDEEAIAGNREQAKRDWNYDPEKKIYTRK
jgi:hypothetical protein